MFAIYLRKNCPPGRNSATQSYITAFVSKIEIKDLEDLNKTTNIHPAPQLLPKIRNKDYSLHNKIPTLAVLALRNGGESPR